MFRFIIWIVFATNGAVWADDCSSGLVSTRERLEASLDRIFARGARSKTDAHLARLDRDIVSWAASRLVTLSPGQRETVFRILEAPLFGYRIPRARRKFLGSSPGMVDWNDEAIFLVLDGLQKNSETAREVLVHELEHLFRDVVDGGVRASIDNMEANHRRRFGVYRDEIYAYRETYRFLRRNYGADDMTRLERAAARYREGWTEAARAGLIAGTCPSEEIRFKKGARTQAELRALVRLMKEREISVLYDTVTMALQLSEWDFVKSFAGSYQGEQRRIHLERGRLGRAWSATLGRYERARDYLAARGLSR